MIHSEFHGNSYEAGRRYGALARENGVSFDEAHILGLTPEKQEFAQACLPIYERFCPELVEEVRGIARGQEMEFKDLAAFLFGMYCFVPACHCTCFAFPGEDGPVLGRNSDFFVALEPFYDSCLYRAESGFAFIGNTTALVQMEDGMNERGFAIGLTFVPPRKVAPGLNAGLLLRRLLQHSETVEQALVFLQTVPIASSHTLTLADRAGDIAVVECTCNGVTVIRPTLERRFVAAVNRFYSPELAPNNFEEIDDWRAAERYQTVCRTLEAEETPTTELAMELLAGKRGFTCQYDRASGADTVWSAVYRPADGRSWRAEGNPGRAEFCEDTRLRAR